MKNTILFFFLLLAAAVSAQSNSFVTDRLRAAEYLRIGTNTSQKVTGFDKVITAPGTHDSLPTSRAVVDFLEANFTPIGYYTAGTGISISDDVITNTAPDQVVGLTGGGITVVTGTYPNFTITSNEVDGSTTNELQNLSLSGQSLSISSGTGVTLPVVGVTAGTGIGVSGSSGTFTVTNTGDLSSTNEIQTLSLSGSDLSLSLGGGTVTLPGGVSWPLLAPDGTGANPSYAFANSEASGMYYDGVLKLTAASQGVSSAKSIEISAGTGIGGNGGNLTLNAGSSAGRGGGAVFVNAGSGNGRNGGNIIFTAGAGVDAEGGQVTLIGGDGTVVGGSFNLLGGNSSGGQGGTIALTPGNGVDVSQNGYILLGGNGVVFVDRSNADISAFSTLLPGMAVYCVDCTANDGSTGVMQVYNGTTWKNCW